MAPLPQDNLNLLEFGQNWKFDDFKVPKNSFKANDITFESFD